MTTASGDTDGAPTVAMGRRFLPLPAVLWSPHAGGAAFVELPAVPGTPVHAVSDGRVVEAAAGITGELVVRDVDERLVHYRRLLPSSVQVHQGDRVEAGQVVGVVGPPSGPDERPNLAFGIKSPTDDWLDVAEALAGAGDPDELFRPAPAVALDPLAGTPPVPATGAVPPPPVPAPAATVPVTPAPGEGAQQPGSPERSARDRGRDRRGRRPADPRRIAATAPDGPAPRPRPAPVPPAPPPDAPAATSAPGASAGASVPDAAAAIGEPGGRADAVPRGQSSDPRHHPPEAPAGPPLDVGGGDQGEASAPTDQEQSPTPAGGPAEGTEPDPAAVLRKLAGRSRRKER